MSPMSDLSSVASWTIPCMSRQRNVNFMYPQSPFLGYIIAKDCLQMDPAKVSAVTSWPDLETRKQLQCFLGFCHSPLPLPSLPSPHPRHPSAGLTKHKAPLTPSRLASPLLPSSRSPTLSASSLMKWTHPAWGWGQFCLSDPPSTTRSTPAPFSLAA